MEIYTKPPSQCSDKELNEFLALALEGGEVIAQGLLQRIQRAEELIFIKDDVLIGIGAIKRPYDNYKNNVFKKAGVLELAVNYSYELGWIYSLPSSRGKGVGRMIMETITRSVGDTGCFATTRENNGPMHHLFSQYSFSKLGTSYKSDNGYYSLVLYATNPEKGTV